MITNVTLPLLRRLSAFTTDPSGGNPAGVWVGEKLPPHAEMKRIAAEVGYSETAFLAPTGDRRFDVRYYSPQAEVSFCGHATIASGVLLGELSGSGTYHFDTAVGEVQVAVEQGEAGTVASLTSVEPRHRKPEPALLDDALAAFGWSADVLDPTIPPVVAYAGAWHLVLPLADRARLDAMEYDFERLLKTMLDADLTTVQLLWRESPSVFHARNPFPVGGVVEDPATGASSAALGGYLRDAGLIEPPVRFLIRQGEAMGRPSRIEVHVPAQGGITVSGHGVALDAGG